jgi:hypothetical protein
MRAAAVVNQAPSEIPDVRWTAPPAPMVDPSTEGLAYMRNIRAGLITLYETIRERGYDPDEFLDEVAAGNKKLDELGIILDCDPRQMSQAGLTQGRPAGTLPPAPGKFADPTAKPAAASTTPEPTPPTEPDDDAPAADERRVRVGPQRIAR